MFLKHFSAASGWHRFPITLTLAAISTILLCSMFGPAPAVAADGASYGSSGYVLPEVAPTVEDLSADDLETLRTYMVDTYSSLEAMTDSNTGLVADNIDANLSLPSSYTSPTNIGGYLWSTVVARDLGIISADDAAQRVALTLRTLESMDRHEASGMFYNWYDPATAERVLIWPEDGNEVNQFLSSVDNGWLAAALQIVAKAFPSLSPEAMSIYDSMRFDAYYNPEAAGGLGLIRGGFWDEAAVPGSVECDYLNSGTPVYCTGHHYDTTVSETRIALYVGISKGEIPATAYYGTYRSFPSSCDWDWQQQRPSGVARTYGDVTVFEGTYHYGDMSVVPGWGGSMFEALMPDLLVPEATWGPDSWGKNHPLTVKTQMQHGLDDADYGYWGFSPSSDPHGGYHEYGVDMLGLGSDGYFSDGKTKTDVGFYGCREATNPAPDYGDGVVTPHAVFLALGYQPLAVLENLENLRSDFAVYGEGGFYDAVAVRSGTVAERYLSLDQAMIVAAVGNFLSDDILRDYFVTPSLESNLRPLMAQEVFSSSASQVLPQLTSPRTLPSSDGQLRLQGTAEPGSTLTIGSTTGTGAPQCDAQVSADGLWSCTTEASPGTYEMTLETMNDAGFAGVNTIVLLVTDTTVPPVDPEPGEETGAGPLGGPEGEEQVSPSPEPESAGPLANTGAAKILAASILCVMAGILGFTLKLRKQ